MADDTKACASQHHSPPVAIKSEPAVQLPQDVLATSPLVKLIVAEIAQDESLMQLVAYSSSPPPLTADRPKSLVSSEEATKHDDMRSLRNQLELSAYEYAALEERYRTLQVQHSESRKLGQTLNDVIYGSSSYEDQTVSIEQLRAEAGHEGLRAKALKLDAVRPIIRGAGGLQLMMTQAQSISSLIEDAGGLEELRALVADAHMLRFRVHEVGGLAGIDDLISQVNVLQSSHRDLVELKAQLDKPDGLRAKVQKYSKLQQAFYAIETGATFDSTQMSQNDAYPLTHGTKNSLATDKKIQPAPTSTMGMNPARAQLLTKAPTRDPNRDLYEPKPPVTNPHNKTGSNDVPLGQPRGGKRSEDMGSKAFEKRRHDGEERVPSVAKRPRVDLGRASALVQATLASSNARSATST